VWAVAFGTALGLLSAPFGAAQDAPTIGTRNGQMYPDFYLPKIDGGAGRLSDFRGKKILLFTFASW
jgi:hypothetical protein